MLWVLALCLLFTTLMKEVVSSVCMEFKELTLFCPPLSGYLCAAAAAHGLNTEAVITFNVTKHMQTCLKSVIIIFIGDFWIVWSAWSIGSQFKKYCNSVYFFWPLCCTYKDLVRMHYVLFLRAGLQMKNGGQARLIHFGWTKSLLFHHPAVWVYNDPVYSGAVLCYTAEQWGLTQNHLHLQALCKTSVFFLSNHWRWPHSGLAVQICERFTYNS